MGRPDSSWRWIIAQQTVVVPAEAFPQHQPQRLQAARQFAVEAARLAQSTRCQNVLVLDMVGVSPVTDFFVIATGTSARQMRTVCDDVDELAEKLGFAGFHRSGYEGQTWIAVDYVDVVLHIFSHDARLYYDLENLWGDAKRFEWKINAE